MKLSIIVSNYNYGHFIEEAIRSIFQCKERQDFEVVIIDDASTDNSREIIQRLCVEYTHIRFFTHQKNLGVVKTVSEGVKYARGEYLHLLSSDDLYLPQALDKILDYLYKHSRISIFSSDYSFFYNSEQIQREKFLKINFFQYFSPEKTYLLFKYTDFWMPGHTVFLKKSSFLKFGALKENLKFICDWYLFHKIALHEGFGYIPEAISSLRLHQSSYSNSSTYEQRRSVWFNLLCLLDAKDAPPSFYQSGITRMLGLRPIYKDLIKNPFYWKYLLPMLQKELRKRLACMLRFNRQKYLLKKIHD